MLVVKDKQLESFVSVSDDNIKEDGETIESREMCVFVRGAGCF